MLKILRSLWEDFKAWRRGEVRIAPRSATRGRIYAPASTTSQPAGNAFNSKATPKATLTMRVHRVDGSIETRVVPATASLIQNNNG